jgi:hypothetical protein
VQGGCGENIIGAAMLGEETGRERYMNNRIVDSGAEITMK